jgi:predicted Rossmann fold nucleotide-binding protein DprA/Smf involved in DNA uptake
MRWLINGEFKLRVIIAGSRHCNNYLLLKAAIKRSGFQITEVVSGGARGVDTLGEKWAKENGIPFSRFSANWSDHGKAAGPIRNQQMAKYAGPEGALIAILYPDSRGTKNMIEEATKRGLKVYVEEVKT